MKADKRKIERFVVRGGAFAGLGRDQLTIGVLKDISMSGLSFEHLYDENSRPDADYVDIWITKGEFFLRDIPCSKMYEITPATDYDDNQFSTTIMNRCGLKFGPISTDQAAKLSSFINTYATQPAQPAP